MATLVLLPCASLFGLSEQSSPDRVFSTYASDATLIVLAAALILRPSSPRLSRWVDDAIGPLATGMAAALLFVGQSALSALLHGEDYPRLGAIVAYAVMGIAKPGGLVVLARDKAWGSRGDPWRAATVAGAYWLAFALPVSVIASMRNELPPEDGAFGARDALRIAALVGGSAALVVCGIIGSWRGRRRRACGPGIP